MLSCSFFSTGGSFAIRATDSLLGFVCASSQLLLAAIASSLLASFRETVLAGNPVSLLAELRKWLLARFSAPRVKGRAGATPGSSKQSFRTIRGVLGGPAAQKPGSLPPVP